MNLEIGSQTKKVEALHQFTLEQFYERTQPKKLEAFKLLFSSEILNKQLAEAQNESDSVFKQLRLIDILYRKLTINEARNEEVEQIINKLLDAYKYEAVVMVLSMLNSLSVSLSSLELFSLYEQHSVRVKEFEKMMIEYITSK